MVFVFTNDLISSHATPAGNANATTVESGSIGSVDVGFIPHLLFLNCRARTNMHGTKQLLPSQWLLPVSEGHIFSKL